MELPIKTRYIPVLYILPYFICIYVVLFYQLLYCYVCIVLLYACCTLSENDEIKLINQSIYGTEGYSMYTHGFGAHFPNRNWL